MSECDKIHKQQPNPNKGGANTKRGLDEETQTQGTAKRQRTYGERQRIEVALAIRYTSIQYDGENVEDDLDGGFGTVAP